MDLQLFIPCFIDQCAPEIAEALVEILARLAVPWKYPEAQTCCGQFAVTLGDPATVRLLMRHFLRAFGPGDILCPSASCTYTVRRQYPTLANGFREQEQIAGLAARVWELSEWLATRGPLPWIPRFDGALVLHRSCKARQLGALPGAAQLLSQVAGLEVRTVSSFYSCCGFGGAFSGQHPEISRAISDAYLTAVMETGAAGLVSLDYSCLLHLRGVAAALGLELKFFHLAQVLTMTG